RGEHGVRRNDLVLGVVVLEFLQVDGIQLRLGRHGFRETPPNECSVSYRANVRLSTLFLQAVDEPLKCRRDGLQADSRAIALEAEAARLYVAAPDCPSEPDQPNRLRLRSACRSGDAG